MNIEIIKCLNDNYSYLIFEEGTNTVSIIDPAEFMPCDKVIKKYKKLDYILNTHHHADHVDGNLQLKKKYNAKILGFIGDKDRIPGIDIFLKENQCQKIFDTFIEIKKKLKIAKNHTIINCTTVSPSWVKKIYIKLKKNNFEYIDCPVSGGPKKAINGKLSLIISSKESVYKKNLALLKNLGNNIYNLGNKIGTGSTVKIINNCLADGKLFT